MNKKIALIGDKTTTGGEIVSGEQNVTCKGSSTALIGDQVFCPKCESIGIIIEGTSTYTIKGKPVAFDGCLISCQCPIGTHRIIATKSIMSVHI